LALAVALLCINAARSFSCRAVSSIISALCWAPSSFSAAPASNGAVDFEVGVAVGTEVGADVGAKDDSAAAIFVMPPLIDADTKPMVAGLE
jgi:hypothetical protein